MVRTWLTLVATIVLSGTALPRADTIRESQWYLDAVHAPQAQAITRGQGVVVAVIDSGVDAGHPDLAGAVLPGMSFSAPGSQAGQTDPDGHGTKMAGIIAARGGGPNNALGIAPASSILPVAVNASGSTMGSLAPAVTWAVDHGAKVISMSIGRPPGAVSPPGEVEAISAAVARGVVVVTSVGNRPAQTGPNVLTEIPGVVTVSGTGRSGTVYSGSIAAPQVALAAPGEDIVSAALRSKFASGYSTGTGTSEATAIVSGIAALIVAKYPDLNGANVINRLIKSSVDAGPPGRDDQYGFGIVDAQRALTMDIPLVDANPLGQPAAGPGGTDATDGTYVPPAASGGLPRVALFVCGGVVLLVVALLVGLVIWLATRRRVSRP
jgi:type VII secretion-associated serine protease mycosin